MAIRRNGRELSPREQAKYVREITGWTPAEYKRHRDVLYNRVRNYERATGKPAGTYNVSDLLARDERAKYYAAKTGQQYQPTGVMQAIESAPATSVGRDLTAAAKQRVDDAQYKLADRLMGGIINNSKYSAQFAAEIDTLRAKGELTGEKYYKTAERYARKIDEERKAVAAANANIVDPWDAVFFTST